MADADLLQAEFFSVLSAHSAAFAVNAYKGDSLTPAKNKFHSALSYRQCHNWLFQQCLSLLQELWQTL
jgi:hypothetical protein